MIILQLVIIVGAFVAVMLFAPKLDYPGDRVVFEDNIIEFRFRNANVILIDDNPEFSSAQTIDLDNDFVKIRFKPGTYYWKAVGMFESSSQEFTIDSKVGLDLDEDDSKLRNSGNVALNVSKEDEGGISGLAILDVEVEYPVDVDEKVGYRGEEYDK